jgi:intergrase/recombinase
MAQIIKFAVLTGLRPSETVESVGLLNSPQNSAANYYNPERQVLEHFRFPGIFLRQTKKAYISFVSPEVLDIAQKLSDVPSYNAIRLACRKRGINTDMRFCRKIHGSWLHQCGITVEEVDFLQGRVSPSVFSRHY